MHLQSYLQKYGGREQNSPYHFGSTPETTTEAAL